MTVPGVAAALLLAAGLALGILLVLLAPQARGMSRSRPAPPPPPAPLDDDLPGFLAAPPGSDGRPAVPRSGWAVLSPAPAGPPVPAAPEPFRAGRAALVAGVAALVLLAASLTVMATAGTRRPAPAAGAVRSTASHSARAARTGISADLTFAGIVLERRAVGVTAAYPHVRISAGNGAALAHVELVTFNCLADTAPRDPVAAGCSRVVPQYAELASPALQVTRSPDGGLAVHGRFPTYVRPNGTPPARTGDVYELRIEVTPRTPARPGTDVPVTGFLQLGDGRAPATPVSVVRLEP